MVATRVEVRNGGYVLVIDTIRTIRLGVESQKKKLSLRISLSASMNIVLFMKRT